MLWKISLNGPNFSWLSFLCLECWPQVQVPLKERTASVHRAQRPADWWLDNNHQGTVTKVREGHRFWIDQGTEKHFARHDFDGGESLDVRYFVLESKESRRDDQWIQDQLPTVAWKQDSQCDLELLLQVELRTPGKLHELLNLLKIINSVLSSAGL